MTEKTAAKQYVHKRAYVNAIQFTGNNQRELKAFCPILEFVISGGEPPER